MANVRGGAPSANPYGQMWSDLSQQRGNPHANAQPPAAAAPATQSKQAASRPGSRGWNPSAKDGQFTFSPAALASPTGQPLGAPPEQAPGPGPRTAGQVFAAVKTSRLPGQSWEETRRQNRNEAAAQSGAMRNIYQGFEPGAQALSPNANTMAAQFGGQTPLAAPANQTELAFNTAPLSANTNPAIGVAGQSAGAQSFMRPDIQKWMDTHRNSARGLDGMNIVERFEKKQGIGRFAPAGGAEAAPAFAAEAAPAFQVAGPELGVQNINIAGSKGFFGQSGAALDDQRDPASRVMQGALSRRAGDPASQDDGLLYNEASPVTIPETDWGQGFTSAWMRKNQVGSPTGMAQPPVTF